MTMITTDSMDQGVIFAAVGAVRTPSGQPEETPRRIQNNLTIEGLLRRPGVRNLHSGVATPFPARATGSKAKESGFYKVIICCNRL